MGNFKHKMIALAGFLLTAGVLMAVPVTAHAEEFDEIEMTEDTTEDIYNITFPEMQVASKPDKVTYYVGEELDITGLTVNVQEVHFGYSFDKLQNALVSEHSDMLTVSGFDSSKAGTCRVTVTCNMDGKTAEAFFDVNILEKDAVGVTDAVLMKKYLHGKQGITQEEFIRLDRNQDNQVNIFDFIILKQELISERISQQVNAEIKLDKTSAVYSPAWDSAMSNQSYVIKSVQELDEIITPMFQAGVVRELKQNYDEAFFENYVLCLDLEPQEFASEFELEIADCAYTPENQLQILYQKNPVSEITYSQDILIGQVAVPKDQYHENEVVWNIKNADAKTMDKPIDFTSKSECISYSLRDDADWNRRNALVTTYDELTEFLGAYLEEEKLAEYQELYSKEFFATKSVYLQIDERYADSDAVAWRVTERIAEDNTKHVNIDLKKYPNTGCVIELFLHQVIIDKVENPCVVDETEIELTYDIDFDGNVYYYEIPEAYRKTEYYGAIAVNIYEFGNQKEIAVYKVTPMGMVLYGHHELLSTSAYSGEEDVFKHYYDVSQDENGNYIDENFEIIFSDDNIIINYKNAENPIQIAWN